MMSYLATLYKDMSISAVTAGFVAVLVGFASAIAIVFQAAIAIGANQAQLESWVWALGIGMGISSISLSLWYKRPLIIAWSTPGAALLAASVIDLTMAQAIGVFLFVGALIFITGISGMFSKLVSCIPVPIASSMLAGILFQFGLGLFDAMQNDLLLVGVMLTSFVIMKLIAPRLAIAFVLIVAILIVVLQGRLDLSSMDVNLVSPVFVSPEFSLSLLIGIGLPMFIVTMSSQNLPGVAVLKASGYQEQSISPVISMTGITTLLFAPFGGFTFNLAAITAAICMGEDAHPDKDKRYVAGLSAGIFNIFAGIFGTAVVGLFIAFPKELVAALAGLALLNVIASSLKVATASNEYRDAAILTFVVTASNFSLLGISSAFWGLVIGMAVIVLTRLFNKIFNRVEKSYE
ncbi:benzoate/H(+) symporter BenE family transporter [Agaribacter marinus]|uniref:Membrane protein n=1 Tax=Agaribacter marinus TaxID=1431249 RepID=A0AA37SX20_9ALTE|nr:benzoate/H(+) symporter BenE family transporter [Agaribacter marinus]GLR69735.1 membrane protein [Agaribacter marinus]